MSLYEFGYNPLRIPIYWEDDWDDDHDDYEDDITFYRPDGTTEGKTISWCKGHGFYEIREGLWSGDWYYRHFPDEKKKKKAEKKNNDGSIARVAYEHHYRHVPDAKKKVEKRNNEGSLVAYLRRRRKKLKGLCTCPVNGCGLHFVNDEKVQDHLKKCNGKAHRRYRQEHDIRSYEEEIQECSVPSLSKQQNGCNRKRRSPSSSMDSSTHSLSDMAVTYSKKKKSQDSIDIRSGVVGQSSLRSSSNNEEEVSPPSQKTIDIRSLVGGQSSPSSSSNKEKAVPSPSKRKGQTDIRSFFQPKSVSPKLDIR